MLKHMMLRVKDDGTSSPGSAAGSLPSNSQAGPGTDPSGPGVAPASPSPAPGGRRGRKTPATCGRISSVSSASVALTRSLGNRCRRFLDGTGSMEYAETWKEKATPAGLLYSEHTAWRHRISDSESTGRPTGWATPQACDARGATGPASKQKELGREVHLVGWATPASRDSRYPNNVSYQERGKSLKGEQLNNQVVHHGLTSGSQTAATGSEDVLAPEFSRWLMGFPASWDQNSPGFVAWQKMQDAIVSAG